MTDGGAVAPGSHEFETVSSKTVYSGAILALRLDQVKMPGGRVVEREVIEHHGAVAVAAIDDDDNVVLINQYRHPIGAGCSSCPPACSTCPVRIRWWPATVGLGDLELAPLLRYLKNTVLRQVAQRSNCITYGRGRRETDTTTRKI